ncbi:WxcM-like domain-containing protein [Pseudodesulfovibrio sp. zrk46]|uniref:WxcM-like domain-containing protein n=1 Tax=Pseudodesulfovibrio sp. zrk46 TaxID=2725288 RepID=UPI001448E895|nr:WxcM-like domain-containing protein [Pseudodesulfovibrio sp. zrk46]QJB58045.1 isomerase [Pseudodesulfovibrio sp. zrk46]
MEIKTIPPTFASGENLQVGKNIAYGVNISAGNNVSIGDNSSVGDNVTIGSNVTIGANVVIEAGVCICDGVVFEDGCHISAGVVFTSGDGQASDLFTVAPNAHIGANATICQVSVGRHSVVKPGTVVTRKVPSNAIVCGNPAKITGYMGADIVSQSQHSIYTKDAPYSSKTGARIYDIPRFSDMRGDLSVVEIERLLPFSVNRLFYTYNIDTELVRGEHAHIECQQFLVSVAGSVNVVCDNGKHREEFVLDNPGVGLHIPHLCWGVQYKHSKDNILLVLASHSYEAEDYIRDYDEFIKYIKSAS